MHRALERLRGSSSSLHKHKFVPLDPFYVYTSRYLQPTSTSSYSPHQDSHAFFFFSRCTMATRRIISQEKTLLEKDDRIGASPAAGEKANIAPAVPT